MTIQLSDLGQVYLVCGKTDMRQGIDSEKYITYLLEHLPNEETLAKREVLEAYLPWAECIQEKCR